jgi:hypothetical protein
MRFTSRSPLGHIGCGDVQVLQSSNADRWGGRFAAGVQTRNDRPPL